MVPLQRSLEEMIGGSSLQLSPSKSPTGSLVLTHRRKMVMIELIRLSTLGASHHQLQMPVKVCEASCTAFLSLSPGYEWLALPSQVFVLDSHSNSSGRRCRDSSL
jgi:hypothetical protein